MNAGTEPNWYPDPHGRHELRYWDGSAWTDHVSNGGVASTDPVGPTAPVTPAASEPAKTVVIPSDEQQLPPPVGPTGGTPLDQISSPSGGTNASSASEKSFPIVPVAVGLAVAAAVIIGIVLLVGGGGGGGDFGTNEGELTRAEPVQRFDIELDKGEAFRARAIPRDQGLDLVITLAVDADAAEETIETIFLSDDFDDIFSDAFDIFSSDFSDLEELPFERNEVFSLGDFDRGASGDAEFVAFLAPVSGTYSMLVSDFSGDRGEFELVVEKWDQTIEFEGSDDFLDEFEDLGREDFFASDAPFFDDFTDFSDDEFGS